MQTEEERFVRSLGAYIPALAEGLGLTCEELLQGYSTVIGKQGFYRIKRAGYPAIVVTISVFSAFTETPKSCGAEQ